MKYLTLLAFVFIPLLAKASFYPESYIESRKEFKTQCQQMSSTPFNARCYALSIPTGTKEDLTTDVLYIPQRNGKTERLVILSSGIHGVEAFTGAAIQMAFLQKTFKQEWSEDMGFLIIHAVNPYGFHFLRRVDEANVDLNRNFSANEKNFQKHSQDYEIFEPFLNPKTKAKSGFWADSILFFKSLYKLVTVGRKKIAQVSVGGQYQSPMGIYFGGKKSRPNPRLIKRLFLDFGRDYKKIFHIDLHTGYGERGKLHFFSSRQVMKIDGFAQLFAGFSIDAGSDEDFYETSGSFDRFTMETFKNKKTVIPMTFEFGTMDSQTTIGGFYSLRNLIFENQGFHHGYASKQHEEKIKQDFLNMFNPSDENWRADVLKTAQETLTVVLDRYSTL